MKRIFLYLLLVLAFAACRSDRPSADLSPQIYLDQMQYTLGKNSVDIVLTAQTAPKADLRIPYRLSGTALVGEDFSVDADAFVLKAGETSAKITLTSLREREEAKSLQIALLPQQLEGYIIGVKDYCLVNLLGKDGYLFSFTKSEDKLAYIGTFAIELSSMTGRYRVSTPTVIDLEIDPKSTAVLGEHYEFVKGQSITVARNRNTGTFQIRMLRHEAGKDKIILHFAEREGFAEGVNGTLAITITGPQNLSGEWLLKKVVNKTYLESPDNGYEAKVDEIMSINSGDKLTLSGGVMEYKLSTSLTGKLANYLPKQGQLTLSDEKVLELYESSGSASFGIYSLPGVNVKFDATQQSLREANIGLRITQNSDKSEVLEMTIYDFEPIAPSWANVLGIMGDMTYTPLRLHFVRQ